MKKQFSEFTTNAIFYYGDEEILAPYIESKPLTLFTFIWAQKNPVSLRLDQVDFILQPGQIIALTPLHHLQYIEGSAVVYQFNREFYCIKDHDKEVGCVGILFYGNSEMPIINLDGDQKYKLEMLHEVFLEELETKDSIQAEMLRLLMARFIIKITRLMKTQGHYGQVHDEKLEIIRMFTFLVEWHFRKEHSVSFYASQLNKSPKTISNYFSKFDKTPLQIIHDRIVLEAKRLLTYTDKSAKEIAFEVGFHDASHLSRLFKKQTGESPSAFKNKTKQLAATA
ncbi:helix-turn-helix domain-containing protein [Dokdonia sp.]|uniref:AraC family transcriptional regulator n=1 Tax=Dokdonia sp. TaxID=2024995 RepID=UPI0032666D47